MSKRYLAIVQRVKEYPPFKRNDGKRIQASTVSWFKIFDTNENNKVIFVSCVVENIGPSSDVRCSDKRILPGKYLLKWRKPTTVTVPEDFREKDGRRAPWLYREGEESLPFSKRFESRNILIHVGNDSVDTLGCLLPNDIDNGNGTGSESTKACNRLFHLLDKIGIENVELEIKEIDQQ